MLYQMVGKKRFINAKLDDCKTVTLVLLVIGFSVLVTLTILVALRIVIFHPDGCVPRFNTGCRTDVDPVICSTLYDEAKTYSSALEHCQRTGRKITSPDAPGVPVPPLGESNQCYWLEQKQGDDSSCLVFCANRSNRTNVQSCDQLERYICTGSRPLPEKYFNPYRS